MTNFQMPPSMLCSALLCSAEMKAATLPHPIASVGINKKQRMRMRTSIELRDLRIKGSNGKDWIGLIYLCGHDG